MKVTKLIKFAFKEQIEYRANFLFGLITMILNDLAFIIIYAIFLSYFKNIGLNLGNFLLLFSFNAFYFGIVHGIFANIGEIGDIIQKGKMDYYLSFPINPLKLLVCSKVIAQGIGDLIFAVVMVLMYFFSYSNGSIDTFLTLFGVLFFGSLFLVGITLIVESISFWLDKGNEISELFQNIWLLLGNYPPEIFKSKKILFILVSLTGVYFQSFLPYYMVMNGGKNIVDWILLISVSCFVLCLGFVVFSKGLKKYTSGNLVIQM